MNLKKHSYVRCDARILIASRCNTSFFLDAPLPFLQICVQFSSLRTIICRNSVKFHHF